jgi:uncharacterized membrane protein
MGLDAILAFLDYPTLTFIKIERHRAARIPLFAVIMARGPGR